MVRNAEDLINKFIKYDYSHDELMKEIRRQIAINDALIAVDIILGEIDVVDDECKNGFYTHWTGIKNELIKQNENR